MSSVSNVTSNRIGFGIVVATITIIVWELSKTLSCKDTGDPASTIESPLDYENAAGGTANGHQQHHLIPRPKYQDSLDDFIRAANRALISAYPQQRPTGPSNYSRVSVLLIQWEEDDLGVRTEIDLLSNVFQNQYGYDCDIFEIPEQREGVLSESALLTRVQRMKQAAQENDLLIVYYGGHSDDVNRKHSVWKSKLGSTSNVNWSLVQAFLLTCPADVLILLDTCFAARGGQETAGVTAGSNELIAATNESGLASGVTRFSFTRVLIEILSDFAEKHKQNRTLLSAAWLCTHMRTNYYDRRLKKPPYYVNFVDSRSQSCTIIPRPNSPYAYLSSIIPPPTLDAGPYKVIISVELSGTPTGDLVTWLEGQGASARYITDVEILQITALYQSNSSTLLIRLPPAVWLLLSPNISGKFVGLVQSDNLLDKKTTIREIEKDTTREGVLAAVRLDETLEANPPPLYNETELKVSQDVLIRELALQNEFMAWRDAGDSRAQLRPNFTEPYPYSALDIGEFRIVQLLAGEHKDPLRGTCVTVEFRDAPKYMALSYVWGPPNEANNDPEWISLDGTIIQLRPNLISALRALRNRTEDIHIWIDTLCIDQSDLQEIEEQIPLMVEIFRSSQTVVVWLGKRNSLGHLAFSFAEWVVKHPSLLLAIPEEDLFVFLNALFTMMRNHWFQRKWVVEDVAFSKEIDLRYGNDVLPWKTMATAMYLIQSAASDLLRKFLPRGKYPDHFLDFLYNFKFQAANQSVSLRDDIQQNRSAPLLSNPRTSLSSLVLRTTLLVATIPQDTVFSMLPIVYERFSTSRMRFRKRDTYLEGTSADPPFLNSSSFEELQSIRSKTASSIGLPWSTLPGIESLDFFVELSAAKYSTPVEEVFTGFVMETIYRTHQLDIICQPWAPTVANLPSWVCTKRNHAFEVTEDNRYSRRNGDTLATPSSIGQSIYSASGVGCRLTESEVYGVMSSERDGGGLKLSGILLGTIDQETAHSTNGTLPIEWYKFAKADDANDHLNDPFWRTLVADRGPDGTACPAWYELACQKVFQNQREKLQLDIQNFIFESGPGIVSDYLKRVQAVIWGRKLVKTDGNIHLVLAPGSSRRGDWVMLLKGCSVPVILRPQSPSPQTKTVDSAAGFTVVGECYVHGMMDGEIFEEPAVTPKWTYVSLAGCKDPPPIASGN